MSSEVGVERSTTLTERRVHFCDDPISTITSTNTVTPTNPSPKKWKSDSDFRAKRKRSWSFSLPGLDRFGNKRRKSSVVPPTKFLLGGNSADPLNLAALDGKEEDLQESKECEINMTNMNPRRNSSVKVIIPPNINDPLNLDACSDNELSLAEAILKQRRRRRSRKRKRRYSEPTPLSCDDPVVDAQLIMVKKRSSAEFPFTTSSSTTFSLSPTTTNTTTTVQVTSAVVAAVPTTTTTTPVPEPVVPKVVETPDMSSTSEDVKTPDKGTLKLHNIPTDLSLNLPSINEPTTPVTPTGTSKCANWAIQQQHRSIGGKRQRKSSDKIVSPVIPQPGGDRKRHLSHPRHPPDKPHLSQENLVRPQKFNPKNEHFQYGNYNQYYGYRNPDQMIDPRLRYLKQDWFTGKEILDIGCNIGHISLTVARDFNPKRVVGIDIDKKLISIAHKNIKHYMRQGRADEAQFPKSMRLLYGALRPPINSDGSRTFPYNVKFFATNYVLDNDELLVTVRQEYDVILCLSVTKWIHLNWGDDGINRFFRRVYANLKPGGKFILEPQPWPSYSRRRKLTERIFDNYKKIRLFPDKFDEFLLKVVGFSNSQTISTPTISTPHHFSKGFQRPIYVYTKGLVLKEGEESIKRAMMIDLQQLENKSSTSQKNLTATTSGVVPIATSIIKRNDGLLMTMDSPSSQSDGCRIPATVHKVSCDIKKEVFGNNSSKPLQKCGKIQSIKTTTDLDCSLDASTKTTTDLDCSLDACTKTTTDLDCSGDVSTILKDTTKSCGNKPIDIVYDSVIIESEQLDSSSVNKPSTKHDSINSSNKSCINCGNMKNKSKNSNICTCKNFINNISCNTNENVKLPDYSETKCDISNNLHKSLLIDSYDSKSVNLSSLSPDSSSQVKNEPSCNSSTVSKDTEVLMDNVECSTDNVLRTSHKEHLDNVDESSKSKNIVKVKSSNETDEVTSHTSRTFKRIYDDGDDSHHEDFTDKKKKNEAQTN